MRLQLFGQRVGLFLAVFAASACTPRRDGASSRGPVAVRSPSSDRHSAQIWEVIDRAARWSTKISALSEPKLVTQPGYVHATIDIGDENQASCFVYDSPIVTGQAVLRLLQAAESGIEYKKLKLTEISEVANNPFLRIEVEYVSTMPPHGVKGVLQLSVSPRVSHPVVCSQERSRPSERFIALASEFVENMTPASSFAQANLEAGEVPLADEYWIQEGKNGPLAFRQWRARRLPTGQLSILEVSSQLEFGLRELQATDTRVLEYEDEQGLLAAEWLSVVNGEHQATVTLRRKESGVPGYEYQYRVVGAEAPTQGTFLSERPLLSSYGAFLFVRADAGTISQKRARYVPPFSLSQPTEIEWLSGVESGTLRMGGKEFRVELAKDGLPHVRHERESGGAWRLHSRNEYQN